MDLLTRTDIQTLAASESDGPHVSLFIPTERVGGGIQADQLRWKNLITAVESRLSTDMRRRDAEGLLEPARELLGDSLAWRNLSDGLAMFLTPDWQRQYRIPAALPTLATVGDHFVTGPLMRLLSGDEHFLLLALSQRGVRLLDGSRHIVGQIELDDVPTSLRDVVEPAEPRSDTMARPLGGGRGGRAVFFGHGAMDDDAKRDDLTRFLRQVALGLREVLGGQTSPMVVVGLERIVAVYREVNTYPHTLDEPVLRNPDGLSPAELHDLAWPIVHKRHHEERARLIDRFHALSGSGQVTDDLALIRTAAQRGRIDTLFLRSDPWCWEHATDGGDAAVAMLGDAGAYQVCEEIDRAASDTLLHGGTVHATSRVVAKDSQVAAILRY